MAEKFAKPDLVKLTRQGYEAANRGDLDAAASLYAADAVYVTERFGRFKGRVAIRGYFEDWYGSFDELLVEPEEVVDLGNGVVFSAQLMTGRHTSSNAEVGTRNASVHTFVDGLVVQSTIYVDIDEGRAAGERLAEERAQPMSANLDIVRSIYADWERGDFSSSGWADREIEVTDVDGPLAGSTGELTHLGQGVRDFLSEWADFRLVADRLQELDAERVLALDHRAGRSRTSGLNLDSVRTDGARLFHIRDGKVRKIVLYFNRERAFADLGLEDDPYGRRQPTSHERRAGQPWDASYLDGLAPWDIGAPQPAMLRLAGEDAVAGAVLDAGCGTGENALCFASLGLQVLGVDVAETALSIAREKAAARGIDADFAVADALHLDRLGQTFDTVLDCGLFHTFDRDERRDYVTSLSSVTARGGKLYVLCFSDVGGDRCGPHPISREDLTAAFEHSRGWSVASVSPDRIQTRFDAQGSPAWLAKIERI